MSKLSILLPETVAVMIDQGALLNTSGALYARVEQCFLRDRARVFAEES